MPAFNPYELIYMSRQGDTYAFEALFHHYRSHLYGIVTACTQGYVPLRPYKEDIYQEASVMLITAIDCYRDDMNAGFSTYYQVLARRRVWNICRSYTRRTGGFGEIVSLDELVNEDESYYDTIPQLNPMNDPVYAMEYREAEERLADAWNQLSPGDREAAMSWLENEPYQVGAQSRGITAKAWGTRRLRVRKKIRQAVFGDQKV